MEGNGTINIDFINVGFGQSIVAYPEGQSMAAIVIDGGDDQAEIYHANSFRTRLCDHLHTNGLTGIELLVATHPHRDHIGGLVEVVESIPVKRFATFYECSSNSSDLPHADASSNMEWAIYLYSRIGTALQKQGAETLLLSGGEVLTSGGVSLEIFSPKQEILAQARRLFADCRDTSHPNEASLHKLDAILNAACIASRMVANGSALLLPADVPLAQWECVPTADMRAKVICASHHGDACCMSDDFLKYVQASIAIISADTCGTYGLPHPEIEGVLRAGGITDLRYTAGSACKDSAGGVRVMLHPDGTVEATYLQQGNHEPDNAEVF